MFSFWKLDFVKSPTEVKAHDTHPGEHCHVAEVTKVAKNCAASDPGLSVEHAEEVEMDKDGCSYVCHHNLAIHT